jgi:predicted aspartyl protease
MWRRATGILLIAGMLLLPGARAIEPGSNPALNTTPDLASPYQPYQLNLRSFFPAPRKAAGVLLHVRINGGRPLRLVLDSGAEFIVIGAKAARSLGLSAESSMELVGVGNRLARAGRAETVAIGPVTFRNCLVTFVDGTVVEGADGVIPLSLFSDFLVRLNLPEKTLRLIPYPSENQAIPSIFQISKHHLLLVETTLNGKQNGYVILDTGASCSVISNQAARNLFGSHIVTEIQLAAGTGAAVGHTVSSIVHFAIAEQDVIPGNVVAMDLSNLSHHNGAELIGVLGYPSLAKYVLTVDYRNGSVKIEPPQTLHARDAQGDRDAGSAETLAFH